MKAAYKGCFFYCNHLKWLYFGAIMKRLKEIIGHQR